MRLRKRRGNSIADLHRIALWILEPMSTSVQGLSLQSTVFFSSQNDARKKKQQNLRDKPCISLWHLHRFQASFRIYVFLCLNCLVLPFEMSMRDRTDPRGPCNGTNYGPDWAGNPGNPPAGWINTQIRAEQGGGRGDSILPHPVSLCLSYLFLLLFFVFVCLSLRCSFCFWVFFAFEKSEHCITVLTKEEVRRSFVLDKYPACFAPLSSLTSFRWFEGSRGLTEKWARQPAGRGSQEMLNIQLGNQH